MPHVNAVRNDAQETKWSDGQNMSEPTRRQTRPDDHREGQRLDHGQHRSSASIAYGAEDTESNRGQEKQSEQSRRWRKQRQQASGSQPVDVELNAAPRGVEVGVELRPMRKSIDSSGEDHGSQKPSRSVRLDPQKEKGPRQVELLLNRKGPEVIGIEAVLGQVAHKEHARQDFGNAGNVQHPENAEICPRNGHQSKEAAHVEGPQRVTAQQLRGDQITAQDKEQRNSMLTCFGKRGMRENSAERVILKDQQNGDSAKPVKGRYAPHWSRLWRVLSAALYCQYVMPKIKARPISKTISNQNGKRFSLVIGLLSLALCLMAPLQLSGQAWSGVLDTSRAIDWTNAGVVGGIPSGSWTQCGTTIAAGASAATIQAAINACGTNQYVSLGAGTFNLSTFLNMKSNMVLRGQGAGSTRLVFGSGAIGGGCFLGGAAICFTLDGSTYNNSSNSAPGQSNAANWTAGYSQGTTSITLASVGSTGIHNGDYIYLDQANDTTIGANLFNCDLTTPACSIEGGSPGRTISGVNHSQLQVVKVVSGCSSACTGAGPFNLTITPGLYGVNWSSGKAPGAWFPTTGIVNSGVENLTIDNQTATGDNGSTIGFLNAFNDWVSGVAMLHGGRAHVWIFDGAHITVQNSYMYQTQDAASQSYGMELDLSSDVLVVNNIMQQVTAPLQAGSQFGNVFAYNYMINNYQTASANCMYPTEIAHDAASEYNLWEGNFSETVQGDVVHGTSGLNTLFRNQLTGYELGKTCSTIAAVFDPYNRDENLVANVLGTPGITTTYSITDPFGNGGVYALGQTHGGIGPDSVVSQTLLRWANYDNVTGAVRFCGNSSDTGWSTTCGSTSEVPTAGAGSPSYANAVPTKGDTGIGQSALPASFIYASTPSWWPSGKPWPLIGPDVTSGNEGICSGGTYAKMMTTSSGTCTGGTFTASVNGGHVNSTPAQDCAILLGMKPDGSGSAIPFDASSCYGSTSLTVNSAHGTVTGTNCSTGSYSSGATIGTCTATAATGYTFTGWSGTGSASGCVGTGTCGPFSLLTTSTLTANYSINSYGLSTATAGAGSGTITCTPSGTVNYNTAVSCTVTANTGSTITTVSGCGGTWSSSPYTFNMPASSCTVTATFGLTTNTLTVSTAGIGAGTVTGTNCTSGTYGYGTTIGPCTANPTSGFFAGWTTATGDAAFCLNTTSVCGPLASTQTTTLTATFSPAVATPTFSPVGGSYGGTQSVTISTSTAGATIYYTTDGTDPTTSSTVYSGPVSVASSLTLKAFATKASYIDSHIGSAVYTIGGTLAAPNFSPGAGTYSTAQTVTISATGSSGVSIANSMTETSNSTDSQGSMPHRNTYTNCATGYSGGVLQPAGQPVGQLYCTTANKTAAVAAGGPNNGVVASTISGTGTSALSNGNGAGGVDSATSITATYAGTGSGCAVGTNVASTLVSGLVFPGAVSNAQAVFGLVTGSNPNTSILSVTKYDTNGDSGRYLAREDCASPNTISAAGEHYEWDSNYNTSGGSYFGFGMDYDFTTSKLRVCPQGCSSWTNVELAPVAGGSAITTYSWPANQYLYSQRYDYWDAGCSYTGSLCAHYGQICLQLWSGGSPVNSLTCYNIRSAATHAAVSFTPLNLTSWTHPQYGPQHQWDINATSTTLTATVPFDSLIAYSVTSSGTPTICYRTDGTDPSATTPGTCDAGSTTYTVPVVISSTTTLKAIATAPGFANSSVASALYTITASAPKVSISGTVKLSGGVIIQ